MFQEQCAAEDHGAPVIEAFRNYKKEMITVFFLMSGANVTYWLILSFMTTYLSRFLKLPMNIGFSLTAITLITYMIGLPIAGYIADKIGRKPLMLVGSAGIAALSYPLFKILTKTGSFLEMASIVCLLAFIFALFQGANTVAMSELFPTRVRVSGFSIAYQLSSAVFAGTCMATVTWIFKETGDVLSTPIYMCGWMAVTLLTTIFLYKETKDKPFV